MLIGIAVLISLSIAWSGLDQGFVKFGRITFGVVAHRDTEPGIFWAVVVLFAVMGGCGLLAAVRGARSSAEDN
jgi:hypothetical protein